MINDFEPGPWTVPEPASVNWSAHGTGPEPASVNWSAPGTVPEPASVNWSAHGTGPEPVGKSIISRHCCTKL